LEYFNSENHFTEDAICQLAEALKLDEMESLPDSVHEHLSNCNACNGKVVELYSIIAPMEYPLPSKTKVSERMSRKQFFIFGFIALGLLLIFFYYMKKAYFDSQDLSDSIDQATVPAEKLSPAPDSLQFIPEPEQKNKSSKPKQKPKRKQVAQNFKPSEELESLIGTYVRSEGLAIKAPIIGQIIAPGTPVKFEWEGATNEALTILILNNKEVEIHSALLKKPYFLLEKELSPGLYYWKLETEDDLIHIGKFLIEKK